MPYAIRTAGSLIVLLSEGQASDYKGALHMLCALPKARYLLGDRGYDADWFREALIDKNIEPCIPPKKNRKSPRLYEKSFYKQLHEIEIMFGRLNSLCGAPNRPACICKYVCVLQAVLLLTIDVQE